MEPWLKDSTYQQRVQCLTGFAACVSLGCFGGGKQVAIGTVSGTLSAVGTTVAFSCEGNTTKYQGEKTLLPRLAQIMEGWRKEDPPTKKKLPVGTDVPEFVAELGWILLEPQWLVIIRLLQRKNKMSMIQPSPSFWGMTLLTDG